jgi:hypothetical protein
MDRRSSIRSSRSRATIWSARTRSRSTAISIWRACASGSSGNDRRSAVGASVGGSKPAAMRSLNGICQVPSGSVKAWGKSPPRRCRRTVRRWTPSAAATSVIRRVGDVDPHIGGRSNTHLLNAVVFGAEPPDATEGERPIFADFPSNKQYPPKSQCSARGDSSAAEGLTLKGQRAAHRSDQRRFLGAEDPSLSSRPLNGWPALSHAGYRGLRSFQSDGSQ